ncbi:hypothetical protein XELAEV_18018400mg [Xenopus laevis]|uniref:Uncharacterized protein n=1 Tax=Xenopus laevis TaxID=8355 RepID=A0A974DFN0_XENLA|nr:hypothetical protein XELAEV_18018400mg [Xenopus laevis]
MYRREQTYNHSFIRIHKYRLACTQAHTHIARTRWNRALTEVEHQLVRCFGKPNKTVKGSIFTGDRSWCKISLILLQNITCRV